MSTNPFELTKRTALSGSSVAEGMEKLVRGFKSEHPDKIWKSVAKIDFEKDAAKAAKRILGLLKSLQPPKEVEVLWFGLTEWYGDRIYGDGINIGLTAAAEFDGSSDEPVWAAKADFAPKKPQKVSDALPKLSDIFDEFYSDFEDDEDLEDRDDYDELLQRVEAINERGKYLLSLGYAGLLVSHVCRTVDIDLFWAKGRSKDLAVATGFDEGTMWFKVGVFKKDGFHPA